MPKGYDKATGHFITGGVPWNKGIKQWADKPNPMFGKKQTEETKRKISLANKGNPIWNKGKKYPAISGRKHWNWQGGKTLVPNYLALKSKKWRQNNPDKINFCNRRSINRRRGASGSHTFGEWNNLKAQYNWTCPGCNKSEPEIKLTEDHIIPIIKGGSNNIENIQPLCMPCNREKWTTIIKYTVVAKVDEK